ncbi:hypothetical protein ACIQAC_34200 [Streptomyces sp. NPDC088387]|uniref:hypothetical protein n=1 Tax=Streptomyces sp. NPDC088387 TaxID=3365859 RepID=UPI003804C43B
MTTPPDAPMFDVPQPPNCVERLLTLACRYIQHNDTLDVLLQFSGPPADPDLYMRCAHRLQRETNATIEIIPNQPLHTRRALTSTVARLKQLAHLSGGAARHLATARHALGSSEASESRAEVLRVIAHDIQAARELTVLAPEAVVEAAIQVAPYLPDRNYGGSSIGAEVTPRQREALLAVARGHISIADTPDGPTVHTSTRTGWQSPASHVPGLEDVGLVSRAIGTAPPSRHYARPQDRVHLTEAGIMALSSVIAPDQAGRHAALTVGPHQPAATRAAHR